MSRLDRGTACFLLWKVLNKHLYLFTTTSLAWCNYRFIIKNGGVVRPYLHAHAFINDPGECLKGPAGNEIDKNFVGLLNLSDNQQVKIRRYSAQIVREDASEV